MKKQSLITILLTVLMSMVGVKAFAFYDIEVENADGVTIYYKYINDGKDLEVTYKGDWNKSSYEGVVVIPEDVTYMSRTRKVTRIGEYAFYGCKQLTSVTIPNSVTSIGKDAFSYCSGMTSVHISDIESWCKVTYDDISSSPLYHAHHLFLNGDEIKDLVIPNNVTSIGWLAFFGCSGLTSVIIPNSVTSIESSAFAFCSGLTSVTIPNSVTSIGNGAFEGCNMLISVTIPNSVTSIGGGAFKGCNKLISVTIPNSVTSINTYAFYDCNSLTSVTIPNSVTSIGWGAFQDCNNLTSIISLIENPFEIEGKSSSSGTFDLDVFNNVTLYVPVGTIDKYKATEGWKDFLFVEEGTGPSGGGDTPTIQKCAKPTISYQNGKLIFNCDTEGATCQSTITDTDITSYSSNEVQLGVTYNISVYATKAGYENSETAMATLCWIDVEPKTEGITNIVSNVRARAILIQSNGNQLTITGADEGTAINVFDIAGRPAGSAIVSSEATIISTSLRSGDIGIVKIGEKAVKVLMK